jgi:hypothetical protein
MSARNCQISSRDLTRIAFNKNTNQLLITDSKEKSIKKINLIGDLEQTIKPMSLNESILEAPYSICINFLNEICIYDWNMNSILIFDEIFNLQAQIDLNKYIQHGKVMNYMVFDTLNPYILYFTNTSGNKVQSIDIKTTKLLNEVQLDSPFDVKIDNEYLYVTSSTSFGQDSMRKKIGKIINGSNCIFILNKGTFELVKTIRHQNWVKPKGIHVDFNGFIWTTAFKTDELNDCISDFLYLFILNFNGEILNSICLNLKVFSDFFVIERKIFFCAANCLRLVKLD